MRGAPKSRGRRTNLALLVLVPLAVLTGLFANTIGTDWLLHPATIHGIAAFGILIVSPWKQAVVRRGLGRRRSNTWLSIALLGLIVVTLGSGLAHGIGYQGRLGPFTVMQVHIVSALGSLVLVWFHYRSHPVRIRLGTDLGRRSFLRATVFAGGAATLWLAFERGLDAFSLPGGERRFTGSHERSSFTPSSMPVTSWLDDRVQRIDPDDWRLNLDEGSLTLENVQSMPFDEFEAVLDCTSAWYSEQRWAGVRLDRLVEAGSNRSVVVKSQTGYSRRFPVRDLDKLWLVTHLGGKPLSAGHGFPARIAAPGRRGFWWVKWVVEIRTSEVPWWVQLPFPAT